MSQYLAFQPGVGWYTEIEVENECAECGTVTGSGIEIKYVLDIRDALVADTANPWIGNEDIVLMAVGPGWDTAREDLTLFKWQPPEDGYKYGSWKAISGV